MTIPPSCGHDLICSFFFISCNKASHEAECSAAVCAHDQLSHRRDCVLSKPIQISRNAREHAAFCVVSGGGEALNKMGKVQHSAKITISNLKLT
jgi:hypothetical protein